MLENFEDTFHTGCVVILVTQLFGSFSQLPAHVALLRPRDF